VDSTVHQGIIEKYDEAPALGNGYSFRLNSAEVLDFSIYSGTTYFNVDSSPRTIPLNQWTHVAGVFDATAQTMSIYHSDDDLVKSPAPGNYGPDGGAADPSQASGVSAPTAGTNQLQIGKDYAGNAFNGNIDEVRIYNRALTQAEIAILKNGQPMATGLVAAGAAGQINLSWTAAAGATSYSLLRGTASGSYTTVVNGITGTSTSDTTVSPGTPYFYVVVAVSVMASANSNESSATAAPAGPPPPPPPPPGPKVPKPKDNSRCGCATAFAGDFPLGMSAAALLAAALLALPRRRRAGG
jgi:hypothetical protein